MHRSPALALALALALTACSKPPIATPDLTFDQRLRNPLFAERYWDELVDRMANLRITKDPLLKDEKKAAVADRARESALELSRLARQKRIAGLFGPFIAVAEQTDGHVLLYENMLYLSTTFATYPGPSLSLFLSSDVDPRGTPFPNDRAVRIGQLQSPYGAQTYPLPDTPVSTGTGGNLAAAYRTVVLWDTKLERMHAFAQLSK